MSSTPARAELIRDSNGKAVRDGDAREAQRGDLPGQLGGPEVVEADPGLDQIGRGERLGRNQLDRRLDLGDPVAFDAPDDRNASAVRLGVEELVADVEWNLVAKLE